MHDRTAIRRAAKAALKADAGIVAAKASVHAARMRPFSPVEMPAFNVHTPSESVDDVSQESAPWRLERELSLTVECIARGADETVAETVDELARLAEAALLRDDTLGGTCGELHLRSTEVTFDIDGDLPVAVALLTFSAVYDTTFPAEGTAILPDFDEAHTVWDLVGGESSADRARDAEINLHE